ncbi:MAG: hypothetical protein WCX14_10255 [Dysgonamonadaceae bacterium]
MKNLRQIPAAFYAAFMGFLIAILVKNGGFNIVLFVAIPILSVFIFNFIVRQKLSFKKYFTSKRNLLTTKVYSEHSYGGVPKEIMYEKMIEVFGNSRFRLVDSDNEKLEILAIAKTSLLSWGENLYISFEIRGDETIMELCSVTVFQIYDWDKNEENLADLLAELEDSLII